MKKSAKLLLILSIVLMLSLSAFAIEWNFDGTSPADEWDFNGMSATQTESGLKLNIVGVDIYMSYKFDANNAFEASEYPYVAMVTKVDSTVNYGGIFFTTSSAADMGKTYSQFSVQNDGKWHGYVLDMPALSKGLWNGTMKVFRIDNINAADTEAKIVLNKVGIFKTREEAEAFIAELPSDAAEATAPSAPKEEIANYDYLTEQGISWIFDGTTTPVTDWKFTGMSGEQASDGLKLTMKADDVYMSYNLKDGQNFEAQNYPFVSIVMKVDSAVNYGGFFFKTSEAQDMGATYSNFGIKNDGQWHSYVIDMSKYPHKLWKGTLDTFRLTL